MAPLLSTKKALGFCLTILAAQFAASAAQSQTEKIGMLEGGWVLARDQAQGRCVVQSPKLGLVVEPYGYDKGFMLINIKKANPQELVFTFSREEWTPSNEGPGESDGMLSIHAKTWTLGIADLIDDPKSGLYVSSFVDLDLRDPIWSASTDENNLQAYHSSQGKTVFITAVASNFEGKDPETDEAVTLFTFLTDQKYSTDKMGLMFEFKDTAKYVEKGIPDFAIPLSKIPDLSPLLQCIK